MKAVPSRHVSSSDGCMLRVVDVNHHVVIDEAHMCFLLEELHVRQFVSSCNLLGDRLSISCSVCFQQ